MLAPGRRGRPHEVDFREAINAVRYLMRPGCGWRKLPIHLEAWQTVYGRFRELTRRFLLQTIHDTELMLDRERQGREQSPSAGAIDSQLDNKMGMEHALVKLTQLIERSRFDEAYGRFYHERGRPGLSKRLMAGLHLLKHMKELSDEAVCAWWVENPYFQCFCGEQHSHHKLPLDPSLITRWRRRIGADKLELLLAKTLRLTMETRAIPPQASEQVTVDTTVQIKAVAHPTDSHLLMRGTECLKGVTVERAYVDSGYKGHKHGGKAEVYIAHTRGIASPTIRRELRRRNAIEPVIGHTKSDGLLERITLPAQPAMPLAPYWWPQDTSQGRSSHG